MLKTNAVHIPSTKSLKKELINATFMEPEQNLRMQFLQQQNEISLADTQFQNQSYHLLRYWVTAIQIFAAHSQMINTISHQKDFRQCRLASEFQYLMARKK